MMTLTQQAGDLLLGDLHPLLATYLDIHHAQELVAREPLHGRGVGNDEAVILIIAPHAGTLAGEQANDEEGHVFHTHRLPYGIERAEEFGGSLGANDRHLGGTAYFAL